VVAIWRSNGPACAVRLFQVALRRSTGIAAFICGVNDSNAWAY
jgi:hypothetical protein